MLGGAWIALGMALYTAWHLRRAERASPPRGEVWALPGGPTHVIRGGTPGAPPLLLIHGSDGVALDWPTSPVWGGLAPHADLIAPDRPGHGYTQAEAGTPVTLELNVQRLVELHDALGVGPLTVVGHSYGAAVALALAVRHPERVRSLVLLAPLALPDPRCTRPLAYVPLIPLLETLLTRVLVLPVGRLVALIEGGRAFYPHPMPRAWYRMMLTFSRRRFQIHALAWENRSLVPELRALSRHYPGLEVPAHIVYGAHDRLSPPGEHARLLPGWLPHTEVLEVPDGGHQLHWTHPQVVTSVILAALRGA